MNRRAFAALVAGGILTACAPMDDPNPIGREARARMAFSEIEVVTTGAQFESRAAAERSSQLGTDLRAALRQEFSDRLRPDGVRMVVEVSRLNLAGATRTAFGSDQSRLQGTARVLDGAGRLLGAYPVQIEAGGAAETRTGALLRAGVTSTDRFYRSLVGDFAETTREQILGRESLGQRAVRRVTGG